MTDIDNKIEVKLGAEHPREVARTYAELQSKFSNPEQFDYWCRLPLTNSQRHKFLLSLQENQKMQDWAQKKTVEDDKEATTTTK